MSMIGRWLMCAAAAMVLFIPRADYGGEPVKDKRSDQKISRTEAVAIAEQDARHAYRDLTRYRVEVKAESDGWHVDYVLKNPKSDGGGPHYVIDPQDGHIISKHYEQ